MTTPHIHLLASGGTISSHHDGSDWHNLTGADLLTRLDESPTNVTVSDVAAGPSSSLSVDDMVAIADEVVAVLASGADGVVVTHGTDTIELTAYVTELRLGTTAGPVVFTGSMRVDSHPEPDGPTNLRHAIAVASSPQARQRGPLICLNGEIHTARQATKVDTTTLDAFVSIPAPISGTISTDDPTFHSTPSRPAGRAHDMRSDVVLISAYPGMTAGHLHAASAGAAGLVLEGFGDINVPANLWGTLLELTEAGTIIVLASRPFTPTFRLDGLGLPTVRGAGGLSAQKARLALMAALGTGDHLAQTMELLDELLDPHESGRE
jgi:L-asparaginase